MAFGDDQKLSTVDSAQAPATGFIAETKHVATDAVCTVGNIALKTTELMSNAVAATIHAAATVVTVTGGVVVQAVEVVGIHPKFSAEEDQRIASPAADQSHFDRVQASKKSPRLQEATSDRVRPAVTKKTAVEPAPATQQGRKAPAGGYGETADLDDPKMCGGYGTHESAPVTDTDIAANAKRASAKAAMDRRILESSPVAKPVAAVAISDAAKQARAEELGKRDARREAKSEATAASAPLMNNETTAQDDEPVVTLEEFEKEREENMVELETNERTKVDAKGLKQLKGLKKLTKPSDTLIEVPKETN